MTEQGQAPAPAANFCPLTLSDLESLKDERVVPVVVPQWQRVVYLRSLPADQGLALSETLSALPKEKSVEALFLLLAECISTPEGAQFFTDPAQARAWLGARDIDVLLRLKEEAMKLLAWDDKTGGALKNASGGAVAAASPIA
jgi:hypothetical protein